MAGKKGFWYGKKVLVTGATGFVGSALARSLLKQGAIVHALTSSQKEIPDGSFLEKCEVHVGDVRDFDFVRRLVSYNEIEVVYHFAAYAIVKNSAKDPVSTFDVNIMGTLSVLEACRQVNSVKRVVVSSSDKAYGDHEVLPYTEEHPLLAINTYDASKACADIVARSYGKNYGLPVTVVRCSNIYGPGDRNMTRLIPNTIRRLHLGLRPQLYSDVASMEREFIYIDDVVAAYEAIGALSTAKDVYNVGGAGGLRIESVMGEIYRLFGLDYDPEILERDFHEIQKQSINSWRLTSDTGWAQKVDIADGLKRTVKWYRKQLKTGALR